MKNTEAGIVRSGKQHSDWITHRKRGDYLSRRIVKLTVSFRLTFWAALRTEQYPVAEYMVLLLLDQAACRIFLVGLIAADEPEASHHTGGLFSCSTC